MGQIPRSTERISSFMFFCYATMSMVYLLTFLHTLKNILSSHTYLQSCRLTVGCRALLQTVFVSLL